MSPRTRREMLAAIWSRYQAAGRLEKARILDDFGAATGYDRKYAIGLLQRPRENDWQSKPVRRRRHRHYGVEVLRALVAI